MSEASWHSDGRTEQMLKHWPRSPRDLSPGRLCKKHFQIYSMNGTTGQSVDQEIRPPGSWNQSLLAVSTVADFRDSG